MRMLYLYEFIEKRLETKLHKIPLRNDEYEYFSSLYSGTMWRNRSSFKTVKIVQCIDILKDLYLKHNFGFFWDWFCRKYGIYVPLLFFLRLTLHSNLCYRRIMYSDILPWIWHRNRPLIASKQHTERDRLKQTPVAVIKSLFVASK